VAADAKLVDAKAAGAEAEEASYDLFGLLKWFGLVDDSGAAENKEVSYQEPSDALLTEAEPASEPTAEGGTASRGALSLYGRAWCEQVQLESHDTPLELGPQRDLGVCIDAVHRNPHSGTSDCARDDMLGLAGRVPHVGVPRADQSSNLFCLTCHNASHPIEGLRLTALTGTGTPRECDGRRQPMDWPGVAGGATTFPMMPGSSASCDPTAGSGANAAWSWLADPWLDVSGKVVP
jgi:hypothetical protein